MKVKDTFKDELILIVYIITVTNNKTQLGLIPWNSLGNMIISPKNNLFLVACSSRSGGGGPSSSMMQASCSDSFSPGNSG